MKLIVTEGFNERKMCVKKKNCDDIVSLYRSYICTNIFFVCMTVYIIVLRSQSMLAKNLI